VTADLTTTPHGDVRCREVGTRGVNGWGNQRMSRMLMDVTLHRGNRC